MIRKISLILAGLGCALVLAALVVPMFVNPNNFKVPIAQQLKAATGYQVDLGGDMSLRMLPSARLHVENVKVFSPQDNKPFVELQALDVGVKLLPLFYGQVEMTKVVLKSPVLRLVKNQKRGNWEVPSQPAIPDLANAKNPPPVPEKKSATAPDLLLGHVEITDGTLTYKDAAGGVDIALAGLNLNADVRSFDEPLTFNAKASWNDKPVSVKAKLDSLADLQARKQVPLALSFDSELFSFDADGVSDSVAFAGKVKVKSPSVLDVANWLSGKKQKGEEALVKLDLSGVADCSMARCGVKDMNVHVNDLLFTGSAVYDIASARPSLSAAFDTAMLDVTPYMQKKQARLELISSALAAEGRWSTAPIDFSALGALDGNITLNAGQVIADKFKAGKALLRVRLREGHLASDFGFGELYNGKGNGSLNISKEGRLDGLAILDAVEMEPLLAALADNASFIGKLSSRIAFQSSGRSQQAIISALGGSGNVRIADGSIKGVDIANMVRNVKSAFVEVDTSQRKTDFSEMGGTFTIAGGIISNNDLSMKAPLLRVAGAGKVDLPNYLIDYKITPQFVDTLKGQGGKDKAGLGVPVRVSGPLDNPSYAPDLSGMIEDTLKNPEKLQESLKNTKELLKDKNSVKDLKNLLKGF